MLKSQLNSYTRLLRVAFVAGAAMFAVSPIAAREQHRVRQSPAVVGAPAAGRAAEWKTAKLGALDPHVFTLALNAASCAVSLGRVEKPATLTVIDYTRPSTQKRLWVIDLRTHALLYEELVAHGQGSGANMATRFSNDADTHRSSLGLFATKDTYIGKNGYSLRLDGLEAGINDQAMARAIVIHGAAYVSDAFAHAQGRLGRSWGCPALPEAVAHEVIDRIKETGLIFAYYPDPKWLGTSPFLGCYGSTAAVPDVATG